MADYNYIEAGYDALMSRSIDGAATHNLDSLKPTYMPPLQTAYDRDQMSGQLGDKITVGNITIDGTTGRISIYDGNNETIRIGNL